jgi:hypothetical protein
MTAKLSRSFDMISERDIWATAKQLVDEHGADAPIQAAMRADRLLDRGDIDGQAVWLRILRAAEELLHLPDPAPSPSGEAGLRTVAVKLIEMFGVDARQYAEGRAQRLEEQGNAEGAQVWRGIAIAIEQANSDRVGTIH